MKLLLFVLIVFAYAAPSLADDRVPPRETLVAFRNQCTIQFAGSAKKVIDSECGGDLRGACATAVLELAPEMVRDCVRKKALDWQAHH